MLPVIIALSHAALILFDVLCSAATYDYFHYLLLAEHFQDKPIKMHFKPYGIV